MSQQDEPPYDNTHRAFLQAFLAQSTFTLTQAKPILAAILSAAQPADLPVLPGDVTDSDFASYVAAINASVSPFDLEIRSAYTQGPGPRTRIWALVNTTSDAITQLATTHSPDEIAFVKRVLDDMFDKYNTPQREIMAITNMQAVHLGKAGARDRGSGAGADGAASEAAGGGAHSITMVQADTVLKSLVEEGWLDRQGEYYTLSARGLMELRGWLLETYNDLPDDDEVAGNGGRGVERMKLCHACREIVTDGQRCGDRRCRARLHDHCASGLWRMQRKEACPVCKRAWTGTDFVGIRAVAGGGRGGRGGVAQRVRSPVIVDGGGYDDEDQEGSNESE